MHPKDLSILDFTYHLPDEKIALYPPTERDGSKLLVYKNGIIEDNIYKNILQFLPENSLLIFNNTKVIKARIRFQKPSGGIIEIFCLEPYGNITEFSTIMNMQGKLRWKCMIGGAGKWKKGALEKSVAPDYNRDGSRELMVNAKLIGKLSDAFIVEFSWTPANLCFAEVIEQCGDIPLPPYIKRNTEAGDTERYQTVYAKVEGSVAAPTAGLHFTEELFQRILKKNIKKDFVTLHVGAGTFKPVNAATMQEHVMHAEWIDIGVSMIENLVANIHYPCIAVGTTSARTLESLYWMGVKAFYDPGILHLELGQWEVYEEPLYMRDLPVNDALNALIRWLKQHQLDRLFTQTQILIAPGYRFRIIKGLFTNFHQPQSTLLLLVAAAVGDDWKKIYTHALQNDFRFLSYGDGCLLFIDE